jgi:hypothetical protein
MNATRCILVWLQEANEDDVRHTLYLLNEQWSHYQHGWDDAVSATTSTLGRNFRFLLYLQTRVRGRFLKQVERTTGTMDPSLIRNTEAEWVAISDFLLWICNQFGSEPTPLFRRCFDDVVTLSESRRVAALRRKNAFVAPQIFALQWLATLSHENSATLFRWAVDAYDEAADDSP